MGIQSIKPEQKLLLVLSKAMYLQSFQPAMACFQCLPRLYDKLTPSPCHSTVLVMTTPLISFVSINCSNCIFLTWPHSSSPSSCYREIKGVKCHQAKLMVRWLTPFKFLPVQNVRKEGMSFQLPCICNPNKICQIKNKQLNLNCFQW